jgi:hypothetical protein
VAVGTVVVTPSIEVLVTGVAGTVSVGSVTTIASANISVTGVQGTGQVGSVLVWSLIDDSQNPNWTLIRTAA